VRPEHDFEDAVRRSARRALGVEIEAVPLSYPPSAALGDVASPVCFELARSLRRSPRDLAAAIAAAFEPAGDVARVEVAGGGYLNAFFDRGACLRRWLGEEPAPSPAPNGEKIVVEHTNINPNKAAHIGHLRNAVLGDTLVRCLRHLGRRVEVQNYVDDTGVQVADLVVGFETLRGEGLTEVLERYAEQALRARGERFDYVAWDLYAEVTRYYEEDPARRQRREAVLKAMEEGSNPTAALAAHLAHRMVQHHLRTMERIGVRYELLPHESDILALRFWDEAFSRLKSSGAIHRVREGKNEGCWVMDLPGTDPGAGEDQKIIVRSNGTVTYVGKDIAYQAWKFGVLGRDFRYRPFDWAPGPSLYPVWTTTSGAGSPEAPGFGGARRVYNVIDSRQSYLQRVVAQGLRSLGYEEQADRSIHFGYEMVALTPRAVEQLFPEQKLSESERKKPYLEMSGRKGLGVRADDLLDSLLARAQREVRQRNSEMAEEKVRETAGRIAVGALRYYMLRFTRNRVVAFDLDDALAFEGETGPYLQYSVVRARNILGKIRELRGPAELERSLLVRDLDLEAIPPETLADHWTLPLLLSRVDAIVDQAVAALELASVAKHAYILAQAFNSFYHRYPVAQEENAAARGVRTALVTLYHDRMVHLLGLMGIEVPDRM